MSGHPGGIACHSSTTATEEIQMTLRRKALSITAAALVALTAIAFLSAHMVLHQGFARIEQDSARRNAVRVINALGREIHGIEVKAHDWAAWDDTYEFIVDRNTRYAESNLIPDSFAALEVNFIIYLDADGKTVYARGFDLESGNELPLPGRLTELLARGDSLTIHTDPSRGLSGIVMLPDSPLMITSRPIVTSEEKGPIRGTLLFGRYLDRAELERLQEITQLSLEMRNWDDDSMPGDYRQAASLLSPEHPIHIQPLDTATIAGYSIIRDISGTPSLVLRMSMPRDIMAQERRSRWYLLAAILAIGFSFTAISLFSLERLVLRRLAKLGRDFSAIGLRGDFSGRIIEEGRDELSEVAAAGNRMLVALGESHDRIGHRNREMRTIMDTIPIGLITLHEDFRVGGEYSRSAGELFGPSALQGKDFTSLLGLSGPDREVLRDYLELVREGTIPKEDLAGLNPFRELIFRNPEEESSRWLRIGYYPIHRDDSPEASVLVEVEDITGEKELADQVTQTQADAAQTLAVAENPDLFREFLSQASKITAHLQEGFRAVRTGTYPSYLLDELLRNAHTLRGTASAFGTAELAEISRELEDCISGIKHGDTISGDDKDTMEHLEEHLVDSLEKVRQKAANILGNDLEDDDDIWLRIPLREIESARLAASSLCGGEGKDSAADLRSLLRSLRFIPARRGLARALRIIEDLIRRTGRPVDFAFEGGDVLIDCETARELNTPLVHLFRNSIAHGIELPEEREKLGKPRWGRIQMTVRSEGEQVILEFSDDGRGLDPVRIRDAAVRTGLTTAENAVSLDTMKCEELIFLPGFSTAEEIGPLSGRGIGLDAVVESVRKLGGDVSLDSRVSPGLGFVILVPQPE